MKAPEMASLMERADLAQRERPGDAALGAEEEARFRHAAPRIGLRSARAATRPMPGSIARRKTEHLVDLAVVSAGQVAISAVPLQLSLLPG